jgi:hypothetical protein
MDRPVQRIEYPQHLIDAARRRIRRRQFLPTFPGIFLTSQPVGL